MSYESVKAELMKNKYFSEQQVDAHMSKNIARFERVIRTNFNQEYKTHDHVTEEEKEEYFIKHKMRFINNYLLFLIDVYEWKRPDDAPKI